ncbi:hypothetical protein ACA30_08835 [Virgibacillus soli]|uniref:Uncharacterized protein n=2 Tax=Lederbergia galactosidilytica TaxID=217031 RepID=A0A0Q9XUY9_9BACI|nr:hypothetical protein ACA29_11555 [Lederbergia galactosidilytica]KRG15243.1 hypothetical protein ACA30_08835 [Virgibacillus soli]
MMLSYVGLYTAIITAVYLFAYSYIEALRISNAEEKVYGGTFIFSSIMAFVFSRFTYLFI